MATTSALRLGQTFEVSIHGLGHEGQGVGRLDQMAVFVPGALPGERVVARLRRQAKRHLEAELVGVEEPVAERRKPPCILVERCGGCSLQHCNDPAQADLKTDLVRQALQRLAQLKVEVLPILQAASPLGYRNRALIPLERTPEGQLRAGYYRRGSHKIVNMNRCPVLDPRIDALIQPIKADLEATRWPVDVNLSQGGGLRHLSLRVGHHSGEVLITLVSSHNNLPGLEALAQQWQERWPEVVGVNLNIQAKASNVVLGPDTYQVSGRSWLLERFAGHELRIGADTFFQVNTAQAERVVPLLVDFFCEQPNSQVLEAYCGIGTFSLPLAAAGLDVLGLELHQASVDQARANAERNALPKARFEQADVAASLAEHLAWAEALLVDPPRKGLAP
jgi:23S rRNA (uracil1939-C5)-methyltransferase